MIDDRMHIGDAVLWAATTGNGPPMVLCHGGPGASDNLGSVASLIDDLVAVHRYDQRGCGRSSRTPPYNLNTFIEDLDALRAHWGHERWIVGGHSFGASLATAYSLVFPERVQGLLCLDGTGVTVAWREEYEAERDRRLGAKADRLGYLRANVPSIEHDESAQQEVAELLGETEFFDAAEVRKRSPLFQHPHNYEVNALLNIDWAEWCSKPSLADDLRSLSFPALLIHGSGDPRPAWPSKRLGDLLPNARWAQIDEAGHWPWLERPNEFADAVRAWLREMVL